jgi:prepilin-type N-terminal cleavage/methylation domain-containing protein
MKSQSNINGFSLVELLIVIVILGIVAKVAIPMFSSTSDEQKLDVAANEIIQTLRFARSEAMRRGPSACVESIIEPDGLSQFTIYANKVEIILWSPCNGPQSGTSFTLSNPLDKKPYPFYTGDKPNTYGVSNRQVTVNPVTTNIPYRIFFDAQGMPQSSSCTSFCLGNIFVPLTQATIQLNLGSNTRTISVNAIGNVF